MGKVRSYEAEGVVVSFDARRCIHAAKCVRGLPAVFDSQARPWIRPAAASPGAIMEVVARCPTGALQARRTDDGVQEEADAQASIRVKDDGPLYVRGRIEVVDGEGNVVATDTRMALCRCGASKNKPFCDNSHKEIGFRTRGDG